MTTLEDDDDDDEDNDDGFEDDEDDSRTTTYDDDAVAAGPSGSVGRAAPQPRLRRKLSPSSTCSVGAYGPGIRKHGRPARATPGR